MKSATPQETARFFAGKHPIYRRHHITVETCPPNASAEWIHTYNALQDRINTFIDAGRPVPVELLNGSFALVDSCY